MKFKGTWIFLAIVILLGGITFWDLQREKNEIAKKDKDATLVPFSVDQIQSFKIQQNTKIIELHKTVEGWKMTSPSMDDGDSGTVAEFLKSLVEQKSLTKVTDSKDVDLSIYGLKDPAGEVSVTHQNGEKIDYEIGQRRSNEGQSYIRKKGGGEILLATPDWANYLDKNVMEFRDKRIFKGRVGAITEVEVKNSEGLVKLVQKDNKWRAPSQPSWNIDQNRVREFLTQLAEAKTSEKLTLKSIPQTLEVYKIPALPVEVKVVTSDDIWTASFGENKDKEAFVRVNPNSYMRAELPFFSNLRRLKLVSFKDKKEPFNFNKEIAKKIDLQSPLKKTSFKLENGSWGLVQTDPNNSQVVQQDRVQGLLDTVKNLKIEEFTEKPTSLKSENKIVFKDQDDKTIFEMAWGPYVKKTFEQIEKNVTLAKTSLSPDTFYLEQSEIERLRLQEIVKAKEAAPSVQDDKKAEK